VLAAVLVVLYERPGGRGGLRVLLTTRSKELRLHPGQTALPGGKVDKTDAGVVETAVSEHFHPSSNFAPFTLIIAIARWSSIEVISFFFFFGG
jgi:8-oxo-dGTP pyrophosphatase MutT (NUDIX family)